MTSPPRSIWRKPDSNSASGSVVAISRTRGKFTQTGATKSTLHDSFISNLAFLNFEHASPGAVL